MRQLDSQVSITTGMTLCTHDGNMKVLKYHGSDIFHHNAENLEEKGYAPKQLPDASEWRRYKLLVEKV